MKFRIMDVVLSLCCPQAAELTTCWVFCVWTSVYVTVGFQHVEGQTDMKDEEEKPEDKSEGTDLKEVLNVSEVVDLPSNIIPNGIECRTFSLPLLDAFTFFCWSIKLIKYTKQQNK